MLFNYMFSYLDINIYSINRYIGSDTDVVYLHFLL